MNEKAKIIRSLRMKGKTYSEIAKISGFPVSTVGWWLRGFELPEDVKERILERARKKCSINIKNYNDIYSKIRSDEARKVRDSITDKASKEINILSKKDLKLIGSALYWAEGSKHRNSLRFANADPMMIKVIMRFFRDICEVPDEKIKARVHLYPQTNQSKAIEYWKNIVKLPRCNFYPSQVQISRASKGKRSINKLPYGTLHLVIGSTEKRCKAKGWIKGIYEKI